MKLISEHLDHAFGLILPHQAVIDMNTCKLIADGTDQHSSNNRGIHAAGKRQQDFSIAHLPADLFYLILDKILHVPICLSPACLKDKFPHCLIRRHCIPFLIAFRRGVVNGHHRAAALIKLGDDLNG